MMDIITGILLCLLLIIFNESLYLFKPNESLLLVLQGMICE